jgi:hypothetical protein
MRFTHFAAIDWSGAAGPRQKGIAVATAEAGKDPPALVCPGHIWSRQDVLEWLLVLKGDWLVGLDLSPSLAFADYGAYFPGWDRSPRDVRGLWAMVESITHGEAHLGANSFVDHPEASRYFRRHGGRCGDLFPPGAGRFRVVEDVSREQGLCNPYSNFNLVGAAQVGKSSLTGMRLFHRIDGTLPIWPYEPVPQRGTVVVEIYTSIAATAAGLPRGRTKIRDPETLDRSLAALGSREHAPLARYDDHATDAILAAAWLRAIAHEPAYWSPTRLTPELASTEGWTFGVR